MPSHQKCLKVGEKDATALRAEAASPKRAHNRKFWNRNDHLVSFVQILPRLKAIGVILKPFFDPALG